MSKRIIILLTHLHLATTEAFIPINQYSYISRKQRCHSWRRIICSSSQNVKTKTYAQNSNHEKDDDEMELQGNLAISETNDFKRQIIKGTLENSIRFRNFRATYGKSLDLQLDFVTFHFVLILTIVLL